MISCLLIVALVVLTTLPALAEEKIKDISSDHWAYQSVVKLVNEGYLSLYEDNKFKGEEEVSRYKLAEVVYKVLEQVNQEQVSLEEKEILTLKKLATEFRSELVEVASENKELQEQVEKTAEKQKITQEDIVQTNDKVNELRVKLNKLVTDIEEEAAKLKKLQQRVTKLETNNKQLKEKLTEVETKLDNKGVAQEVETLQNRVYWVGAGLSIGLLLLVSN